jgi:hypothetical protein
MKFCNECLCVNGHHPNCPEAEDDNREAILYGEEERLFSGEWERPKKDGDS